MPEGPVLDIASASDHEVGDMTGGAIARRAVLLGGAGGLGALLVGCTTAGNPPSPSPSPSPADGRIAAAQSELAALETRFGGRLGVIAVDTVTGAAVGHRPDERFLLASTAKVPIVAAILRRAEQEQGLLERLIRYDRSALLEYAPATTANLATGMTVAALCQAAITVSDNTAANLLFDLLGGPAAATAFVRTLGDMTTRLDRLEPELNLTTPGDQRDTTTPRAITADLQALTLGDALDPAGRDRLNGWLAANTTGARQIRAGLPPGWQVGDKTGSGLQGESNDIAIARPPGRPALLISVYTAPTDPENDTGPATIVTAATIVARALGPTT